MKERPILFSGEMVRAILDGRKTQTRRVVKGMPLDWIEHARFTPEYVGSPENQLCPYGQSGDRLWVRETFQPLYAEGHDVMSVDWKSGHGYAISYPATDGIQEFMNHDDELSDRCMSSIHMPRWASRITLEIVSTRIERLQDITEEDALAEGVQDGFARLWESINGQESWDANPWVWRIEFKRIGQS